MSTFPNDPRPVFPGDELDPYASPKEPPPEKKGRGCFFWGCITLVILTILMAVLIGLAVLAVRNFAQNAINQYTDTAPTALPASTMPAEERKAVQGRFEQFTKDIKEGKQTEPLVLTADDINAMIEEQPQLKGRAHVDIEGDKIKGEISYPLSEFKIPFIKTEGRYMNGSAALKVTMVNGNLYVTLDEFTVKGKPLPPDVMAQLRTKNLAEDALKNPENRQAIERFERIEVKDGKLYIVPKKAAAEGEPDAESKDDMPKGETKAEPSKEEMPKDEPKVEETPKADETKPADAPKDEPKAADAPKDEAPKSEGDAAPKDAAPKADGDAAPKAAEEPKSAFRQAA